MVAGDDGLSRSGHRHYATDRRSSRNVSQLLTLLLVVTLLSTLFGLGAKHSFLAQSFTQQQLVTQRNVSEIHDGLQATINSFMSSSDTGVSLEGDLLTKKQVRGELKTVISNIYQGKSQPLDPSHMIDQVMVNFMELVQEKKIPTNSEDFLSYKSNFVAEVGAAFQNQSQNDLLSKISTGLKNARKIFQGLLVGGMVLSLVLLISLTFQTRSLIRLLHYSGISFLAAGVILWLFCQFFKLSGLANNLAASIGMYQKMIVDYSNEILQVFVHFASLSVYAGLAVLLLSLLAGFGKRTRG
ncbi:hypothetical protein LFYK43_06940 [Ligilactobacillus salitolerans]|uniref:Uncharacterized protein n=1 Tax=Ligilactobacillus salitolerans TaxID=1808352 RepID=A0A401IRV6_9LACO|nr:hypothetical protein [Ligilactobacillus salitolerans]GBG94235.1 hypothetical protein LFYK43_06940 [Ligilactobacillus salitolerans]